MCRQFNYIYGGRYLKGNIRVSTPYPWTHWVAQKTITLRRYKHYICTTERMRAMAHKWKHNNRKDLSLKVYIPPDESSITLYFRRKDEK